MGTIQVQWTYIYGSDTLTLSTVICCSRFPESGHEQGQTLILVSSSLISQIGAKLRINKWLDLTALCCTCGWYFPGLFYITCFKRGFISIRLYIFQHFSNRCPCILYNMPFFQEVSFLLIIALVTWRSQKLFLPLQYFPFLFLAFYLKVYILFLCRITNIFSFHFCAFGRVSLTASPTFCSSVHNLYQLFQLHLFSATVSAASGWLRQFHPRKITTPQHVLHFLYLSLILRLIAPL